MNIKEFSQPTILSGKQYGTTVTIELDHSDTSIDEVMDGFLTIVKGLGYLDTTVNQWIKDKSMDIYEDEYDVMSKSLADDWFDESNEKELPTECWCGSRERCDCISEPNDNDEYDVYDNDEVDWTWDEDRIDIIGQNGNEGLHYDEEGVDELLKRYNEPETQKRLRAFRDEELEKLRHEGYRATEEDEDECELNEKQLKDYKGVYVEKPTFDWDNGEDYNGQFKDWERETPDDVEFDDYGMRRIPNDKLKAAAQRYSDEVRAKHKPIKLDKTKIRKGKIKDLKK
jgi:hypothetical protein